MSHKCLVYFSVIQFLFLASVSLALPGDPTDPEHRVPDEVLNRISKFYLVAPLTDEQIEKLPQEARERIRARQNRKTSTNEIIYLSTSGIKFTFAENKLTLDGGGYDKFELKRNYVAPGAGIFDKQGSPIVVTANESLISGLSEVGHIAISDGSLLQSMSVSRYSKSLLLNLNLVATDRWGKKDTGFRLVEGGIEITYADSTIAPKFYPFHHVAIKHWLYGAPANVYKSQYIKAQIIVPLSFVEARTTKATITASNGDDLNWSYEVNVCENLLHKRRY